MDQTPKYDNQKKKVTHIIGQDTRFKDKIMNLIYIQFSMPIVGG